MVKIEPRPIVKNPICMICQKETEFQLNDSMADKGVIYRCLPCNVEYLVKKIKEV